MVMLLLYKQCHLNSLLLKMCIIVIIIFYVIIKPFHRFRLGNILLQHMAKRNIFSSSETTWPNQLTPSITKVVHAIPPVENFI